jgi:c-di-GMP-binding flagellar brake protein YcgR
MVERRQFKRFKSNLMITTVYRDEADNIIVEDSIISEDIGAGGIKVVFPRRLPKDKILDLKVFLFSDPIPLSAKGKVVWSQEKEKLEVRVDAVNAQENKQIFWAGIQFVDIEPFTQERIIRLIKKEFNSQET